MALGGGQLSLVEQTVGWTDRKVNEVYLTLRLLVEYVTSNPHTREDNVPDFGKNGKIPGRRCHCCCTKRVSGSGSGLPTELSRSHVSSLKKTDTLAIAALHCFHLFQAPI